MQLDMHYYGTYAIARSAGLRQDVATAVATAAQFVDDSTSVSTELGDGVFLHHDATAHHPAELVPNTNPGDQRHVWVPFHFLPGAEGVTLEERLICRKDSKISKELVNNTIRMAREPYGSLLLGITAHVYADTFSHYGFSGISSELNQVDASSITPTVKSQEILDYISQKASIFLEKRAAEAANLLGLGHGGVATHPDRPYLTWTFNYADGRASGERRNQETFMEACEQLHDLFTQYAMAMPAHAQAGISKKFLGIRATVESVLALEGKLEDRCRAWRQAMSTGKLLYGGRQEDIPTYDSSVFTRDIQLLRNIKFIETTKSLTYQFIEAAAFHRRYVLHELLPQHGLQVIVP